MPVEYVPIKGKDGEFFAIMDYIPKIAKDYGWTSGLFDENLADAIEKARNAEEDPFGIGQSLLTAKYTAEAMLLAREPSSTLPTMVVFSGMPFVKKSNVNITTAVIIFMRLPATSTAIFTGVVFPR